MSNINIDCIAIALMTNINSINCLHTFMSFVATLEAKGSGTTTLKIRS